MKLLARVPQYCCHRWCCVPLLLPQPESQALHVVAGSTFSDGIRTFGWCDAAFVDGLAGCVVAVARCWRRRLSCCCHKLLVYGARLVPQAVLLVLQVVGVASCGWIVLDGAVDAVAGAAAVAACIGATRTPVGVFVVALAMSDVADTAATALHAVFVVDRALGRSAAALHVDWQIGCCNGSSRCCSSCCSLADSAVARDAAVHQLVVGPPGWLAGLLLELLLAAARMAVVVSPYQRDGHHTTKQRLMFEPKMLQAV